MRWGMDDPPESALPRKRRLTGAPRVAMVVDLARGHWSLVSSTCRTRCTGPRGIASSLLSPLDDYQFAITAMGPSPRARPASGALDEPVNVSVEVRAMP